MRIEMLEDFLDSGSFLIRQKVLIITPINKVEGIIVVFSYFGVVIDGELIDVAQFLKIIREIHPEYLWKGKCWPMTSIFNNFQLQSLFSWGDYLA
jgi:hypothetical protein